MEHLDIEPQYTKNLLTLAQFLLGGGKEDVEFDMGDFHDGEILNTRDCGSAGCAVGHASLIFNKKEGESFNTFSDRIFGSLDGDNKYGPWFWCFSGAWVDTDNTKEGAAKRILHFIYRGVPDSFEYPPSEEDTFYQDMTVQEIMDTPTAEDIPEPNQFSLSKEV